MALKKEMTFGYTTYPSAYIKFYKLDVVMTQDTIPRIDVQSHFFVYESSQSRWNDEQPIAVVGGYIPTNIITQFTGSDFRPDVYDWVKENNPSLSNSEDV